MSSAHDFSQSSFVNQLLQSGYLTLPQVQQALLEKGKGERSLTEIIESITGQGLPLDLLKQYRQEQRFILKIIHGIKVVDLDTTPDIALQIEPLLDFIPLEFCRRHQILPLIVKREGETIEITLAMVHPEQEQILDELRKILKLSQVHFERQVIRVQDYQQLITQYESNQAQPSVIQQIFAQKLEQFPHLLSAQLPLESKMFTERLQKVENLIGMLAQEFQTLKQEFQTIPQPPPSDPMLEKLEDTRHWETLVQEFVSHPQTILTDYYEELSDPGDWEKLREDLEPSQDINIEQSFIPTPSVQDPWS